MIYNSSWHISTQPHLPLNWSQADVSLVPNQPENGKYNRILALLNTILKRHLCVYPKIAPSILRLNPNKHISIYRITSKISPDIGEFFLCFAEHKVKKELLCITVILVKTNKN